MEKPLEGIDENTVQKNTIEDCHYAMGYSPEDDLILIYNYDTNDILLSFAGEDFYERAGVTDTFEIIFEIIPGKKIEYLPSDIAYEIFETIKKEKFPGINDELLEEYHDLMTNIEIGTITMDYDPDELDEEITFLEKCLMDEAYNLTYDFQYGFDFEKFLEDVKKSMERYYNEDTEEESRGIGR